MFLVRMHLKTNFEEIGQSNENNKFFSNDSFMYFTNFMYLILKKKVIET